MNRIYFEPQVMSIPRGAELTAEAAHPMPGAAHALGHLADSYELVVVGDPPLGVLDAFEVPIQSTSDLPPEPAFGSWLITDDPGSCLARPPGLKTILIGPRRPATNKPALRFDVEARDLNAAVVEILTREAMA